MGASDSNKLVDPARVEVSVASLGSLVRALGNMPYGAGLDLPTIRTRGYIDQIDDPDEFLVKAAAYLTEIARLTIDHTTTLTEDQRTLQNLQRSLAVVGAAMAAGQ